MLWIWSCKLYYFPEGKVLKAESDWRKARKKKLTKRSALQELCCHRNGATATKSMAVLNGLSVQKHWTKGQIYPYTLLGYYVDDITKKALLIVLIKSTLYFLSA